MLIYPLAGIKSDKVAVKVYVVNAYVMKEFGVTVGADIAVEIALGIEVNVIPDVTVSTILSVPES